MPAVMALLDSSVAALRAKALVCFALLARCHLGLLLQACQSKLVPQVTVLSLCRLKYDPVSPGLAPPVMFPSLLLFIASVRLTSQSSMPACASM